MRKLASNILVVLFILIGCQNNDNLENNLSEEDEAILKKVDLKRDLNWMEEKT